MDVPALGTDRTVTGFSSALSGPAGPKARVLAAVEGVGQSGDRITTILSQLSEPAVLKLLEIIERPLSPEAAAQLEGLLRAATSAATEGRTPQALSRLAEFAALDPRRAETLELEQSLVSIRPEVRQLLSRLASAAHLDAESRLGRAVQLLEGAASKEIPGQEISPAIAILIAGRLLDAGGYANCIRSAELSQMAINPYTVAPTPASLPLAARGPIAVRSERAIVGSPRPWALWIRGQWRRVPLLVLLLAWLAIGFVGGCLSAIWRSYWTQTWPQSLATLGFDVWGVGFLSLIGFGFYAKVRNWRR